MEYSNYKMWAKFNYVGKVTLIYGTSKFACSLKSIKHIERLKWNSSNLATSIFSSKVSYESSFQGETNLSILIGDINSYHGHKRINNLSCFNACRVFRYIMLVIVFAAAGKAGLFGVNSALLVDKYKQTTVITI